MVFGFPEMADRTRQAFAASGYVGALRQQAHDFEGAVVEKWLYPPGVLAAIYAELGDKNRAFFWLQDGCEKHYMAISDPLLEWIKIDPSFASLHSDPRFKDVLHCMGLPP